MGVPLQPHQRKLPQRHVDAPRQRPIVEHQFAVEALGYEGRDLRQAATLPRRGQRDLRHPGAEYDRIDCLHHRNRQIGAHTSRYIQLIQHRVGGEYLGVPLAAEQNAPLVEHAQTLHLSVPRRPGADLQRHPVVEPHIHGVEPPVEGHRLYIGVNIQQLRRAALEHLGAVQHLLGRRRGIEPQILYAVLIPAGVKYLSCMDAHGFPDAVQVADRPRHSIFRHCMTSQ